MASKITGVIPAQNFEIIRNRICSILLLELETQFLRTYDTDLNIEKIYMERMVPFDHTELPALNVGIERGDYGSYHQGQADAIYRYFIESNTKANTNEYVRGDEKAKARVQKLLGKCRYILEDPAYRTLGFDPGIISHRHVESFVFAEATRNDLENTTMSRLILVVKTIETNVLKDTVVVGGNDTRVFLNESDKGYYWTFTP